MAGDCAANALGSVHRPVTLRLWENDHKLLPAPTSQDIDAAQGATDDRAQLLQCGVPTSMSESVVDRLEVVQIQHDDRARALVSARAIELLVEPRDQRAMV